MHAFAALFFSASLARFSSFSLLLERRYFSSSREISMLITIKYYIYTHHSLCFRFLNPNETRVRNTQNGISNAWRSAEMKLNKFHFYHELYTVQAQSKGAFNTLEKTKMCRLVLKFNLTINAWMQKKKMKKTTTTTFDN